MLCIKKSQIDTGIPFSVGGHNMDCGIGDYADINPTVDENPTGTVQPVIEHNYVTRYGREIKPVNRFTN